jgi:hypothetical protein
MYGAREFRSTIASFICSKWGNIQILRSQPMQLVPAPVNIRVKRLKFRLSGSARKSQKRFRDTPMFKFLAVFVRIEPSQRSNERSERGDHPV